MRTIDSPSRFDINDDRGIDDEIGDIPANYFASKNNFERYLTLNPMTVGTQHDRHGVCVYPL